MKNPMKPLAVAAATASLATIALATPASAKGNDPEVGGTMTFDRSSPACTQLEDAKTVGFYWWKNDPFVQKVMQNHKDNCTWLKAGVEYKVREIADAGFDTVFCLIGPENKDHCLWFLRPKGGDFYAPHKKKYQQAGRT